MRRFLLIGVLSVVMILFVVVGPYLGRNAALSLNQTVRETDWTKTGENAAKWLFGQPASP